MDKAPDIDIMSPEASPTTPKTGVKRVNNVPIYIGVGIAVAFAGTVAMVASDRGQQQANATTQQATKAPTSNANSEKFAHELAGESQAGIVQPSPPKMPELGGITVVRPDNLDHPPLPNGASGATPVNMNGAPMGQPPQGGMAGSYPQQPTDPEITRIQQMKMQQLGDAIKSRTSVNVSTPRSAGSSGGGYSNTTPQTRDEMLAKINELRQKANAQRETDPTAAYKAKLEQIRGMTGNTGGEQQAQGAGAPQLMTAASNSTTSGNGMSKFGGSPNNERWHLNSTPEAPRSPYELRAGFVVPATLVSGINSDLPGQIIGQVSQNVYDTPTGKHLIIPQGSRLVGTYSSDVAFGQSRVLVAWQRIVFPDGKALDIGAMPGADSAGYSGMKDMVNNHYARIFGSAFLMSGVTAGITYSQRQNQTGYNQQSASGALSEALGQQLGQVTAQLIAKNITISPTLEIRPGYRFNVVVTKDMTFSKPYQSFDY